MPTLFRSHASADFRRTFRVRALRDSSPAKTIASRNSSSCRAWARSRYWGDGYEWRALRNKQYTYAIYRVDGAEMLFDHEKDPDEMVNLIDDPAYAQVRDEMKAQMKAEMARVNDNFEATSYYRDHWTKDRHIIRTATDDYSKPADVPPIPKDIPRPEYPRPQFVRDDVDESAMVTWSV